MNSGLSYIRLLLSILCPVNVIWLYRK